MLLALLLTVAPPADAPLPGELNIAEEFERAAKAAEEERAAKEAEAAAKEAERIKNFDWGGLGSPSKRQIEPLPPRRERSHEPSPPEEGARRNDLWELEQDNANPYRRMKAEQPRSYRPPPTTTERLAHKAGATVHIWAPIAAAFAFLAALGYALFRWTKA